ncbi:MAG: hypothetical protein IJ896_10655 [Fibrobacter sp.]|nr:hypothetical protein [Fibrobacter sp.]
MLLKPNLSWKANQGITLPAVQAQVANVNGALQVEFLVEEPVDCFRAEVREDNGSSWEDSCVEIFLKNPKNPAEYFNFETTSRGFILAARGSGRQDRQQLPPEELAKITRVKQLASVAGNLICWGMTIVIPPEIFGLDSFQGVTLEGNLYKCADKAKTPHYLSAFPINTEKPDFHRPEFFQVLLQG